MNFYEIDNNNPYKRYCVLVGCERRRRYSAPEYLGHHLSSHRYRTFPRGGLWCRPSTSDLSTLVDNDTDCGSSLELDTSNLSRDTSPVPPSKGDESDSDGRSYPSVLCDSELYVKHLEDGHPIWNVMCSRFIWKTIFLSQAMAGCLTAMNLTNETVRSDRRTTIVGCFFNYVLISMVWTTKLAARNEGRDIFEIFKLSGLRYVLLSILHAEANYFLLSSFRQESYLGNQVTNLMAALLSLVLSFVCLDVQFQTIHVKGFTITVLGAVGFCIANAFSEKGDEICWGDILRIGCGVFLSLSNLAQELIVKSIDSVEYLGMIGFLGSFISGFQLLISPGEGGALPCDLNDVTSTMTSTLVQFSFACLSPTLLRDIGTTGLHLTLITSEFYAHFAHCLMSKNQFQLSYIVCYGLVLCGCYIFVMRRTHIETHYFLPLKVTIRKGS